MLTKPSEAWVTQHEDWYYSVRSAELPATRVCTLAREQRHDRRMPAAAVHVRGVFSALSSALLHEEAMSSHSAFRPSSIAAAVILPDAAESSLKISSALRNAVAATSLSPSTTRERIR